MNSLLRRAAVAGAPVLLLASLTACSGDDTAQDPSGGSSTSATSEAGPDAPTDGPTDSPTDGSASPGTGDVAAADAPTDADPEKFCDVFQRDAGAPQGGSPDLAVDYFHAYGDDLAAIGTPDGIDSEQRAGYVVLAEGYQQITSSIAADASGAYSTTFPGVAIDDEPAAQTFVDYYVGFCKSYYETGSF